MKEAELAFDVAAPFEANGTSEGVCDGVGGGADEDAVVPDRLVGDAAELSDDLLRVDASAEGHGDEARDGFELGRIGAACLAESGEDFEGTAVVVEVDGDVDVAVAGLQALGDALHTRGPAPGDEAAGSGEGLGVFLVRMPFLVRRVLVASTGCEDLFLAAAGAVDSDALAGKIPG